MEQQKSTVGDYYLLCRIYVLINQNLLDWKGNLKTMNSFALGKNNLFFIELKFRFL